MSAINNQFICAYLKDAHTRVKLFDLDGKFVREIEPCPASARRAASAANAADTETFYSFTSFTVPGTIYRYDLSTGKSTVFRQPKVDFNPKPTTRRSRFFITSKDGTRVPMFITHKKGLKLDGKNPTLLYGYGGFNISLTPGFSVANLAWMEMGGVYAVPNLRGGGEYGEDWHQAGTKLQEAKCLRRFHRRGGMADRQQIHVAEKAGDCRRQQRRLARRRVPDAAARPVRRGAAGGRRDGHAALSQVHHRLGVDERLRLGGQRGRVQGALRLFAAAQHQARHEISRRRSSPPPTTTTAWCRRTASSSPPRCRPRRPATGPC